MRLIDADKLKEAITKDEDNYDYMCQSCIEETEKIVDEQPTAYDLDKVFECLEYIQLELKKAEETMKVSYVYDADEDLGVLIQKLKAGGMN